MMIRIVRGDKLEPDCIFKLSPILKDNKTNTKTKVKNSALEYNLSQFHVYVYSFCKRM